MMKPTLSIAVALVLAAPTSAQRVEDSFRHAAVFAPTDAPSHREDWRAVAALCDRASLAGERFAYVVFQEERPSPAGAMDAEERAWFGGLPAEEQDLARDLRGLGYARLAACRLQPDGGWRMLAGHDFFEVGAWTAFADGDLSFRDVRDPAHPPGDPV